MRGAPAPVITAERDDGRLNLSHRLFGINVEPDGEHKALKLSEMSESLSALAEHLPNLKIKNDVTRLMIV